MLTLVLIGVLAGAVTAVSPCVLPVLPAVFFGAGTARRPGAGPADAEIDVRQVAGGTRPALIVAGLVLAFAIVTLAGSLLLTTLDLPPDLLRWAGLVVLFAVGAGLVVPAVQRVLQRPFARLPRADAGAAGHPFVLGLALGTLYVPCAGPVIAAIAIAGATGRVSGGVVVLTAAFSIGTAVPLLVFAYAGGWTGGRAGGGRVGARRFRVAGGVVMMALATALAFNLTDGLQAAVPSYTAAIQQSVEGGEAALGALSDLRATPDTSTAADSSSGNAAAGSPVTDDAATTDAATTDAAGSDPGARADAVVPAAAATGPVVDCRSAAAALANCGPAPALVGIDTWINTPDGSPVDIADLTGKVVLVDFWTFACINCQHVLPYVTCWYDTYRDSGLRVIGVHTPEFFFEHDADNVRDAVAKDGIHYPVGLDNSSATWLNYRNSYWPAAYVIDASGTLRYVKFGEGDYVQTESLIRQLLVAADPQVVLPPPVDVSAG